MESFAKTSRVLKGFPRFTCLSSTPVTYKENQGVLPHAISRSSWNSNSETVVSKMQKSLRGGKVLVDWSQNDDHETTISTMSSLRAKEPPECFHARRVG